MTNISIKFINNKTPNKLSKVLIEFLISFIIFKQYKTK